MVQNLFLSLEGIQYALTINVVKHLNLLTPQIGHYIIVCTNQCLFTFIHIISFFAHYSFLQLDSFWGYFLLSRSIFLEVPLNIWSTLINVLYTLENLPLLNPFPLLLVNHILFFSLGFFFGFFLKFFYFPFIVKSFAGYTILPWHFLSAIWRKEERGHVKARKQSLDILENSNSC